MSFTDDGLVQFGSTDVSVPPQSLPDATTPNDLIAAPFLNAADPSTFLFDGLMICFDWDDVVPVELQSFNVE